MKWCVIFSFYLLFADTLQLPRMNPWPEENSVLVMDNCSIHKAEALNRIVTAMGKILYFLRDIYLIFIGCKLVYLPGYSPDLNPIEESFSSCEYIYFLHFSLLIH